MPPKREYDPDSSRTSDGTISAFIQAPITGELTEVPNIGKVGAEKLKAAGITSTFALMGKYLMLKDEGVGPVELADRFYIWLCSTDFPPGSRAGVVLAIATKLNVRPTLLNNQCHYV